MRYIILLCSLLMTVSIHVEAKKGIRNVPFQFYGSKWSVRVSDKLKFTMPDSLKDFHFDTLFIEQHIKETYDDCIALKREKRLNDWGYLRMLDSLSVVCFGKGNEATLMKTYLFAKTGYRVKLAIVDNEAFYLLYWTKYTVYNNISYSISGDIYYLDSQHTGGEAPIVRITMDDIGNDKSVSFDMREPPLLDYQNTKERTLESKYEQSYPLKITVSVNKNLLDYYSQYPSCQKNYDFATRWAMMANVSLDENVKQQIYPTLSEQLKGLSQLDAVNALLHFVQTALDYEYDEKEWGYDRAFYAEETLFHPYADSEDRVILLSRLVRDIVGVEVVILFFPGHLSMAVHFDEEVEGASIIYNGDRFVIADPTYIGAPVGMTMPDFENEDPERILLLYK